MMIGPSVGALNRAGAKNVGLIFGAGEWWRVITCNWMHAGLIHLAFNMMGLLSLGRELEMELGSVPFALLYIFSGLFGTALSCVFLPNGISVGASGSIFGLMGASWGEMLVQFGSRCYRGEARGMCGPCDLCCSVGICNQILPLCLNLAIGLTPWVDQYMHVGGFILGLTAGVGLFGRKRRMDAFLASGGGEQRCIDTVVSGTVEIASLAAVVVLLISGYSALSSAGVRDYYRTCTACESINCVNTPWWSCGAMSSATLG